MRLSINFILFFLSAISSNILHSQDLTIEGSIICLEEGRSDLKRTAKYIIVVPKDRPDLADLCNESGYYNIRIPYKAFMDQSLTLFFIGKTDSIEVQKEFIARDDLWNRQVKMPTKYAEQKCEQFVSNYFQAQEKLDSLKSKTYKESQLADATSVVGAVGNLLYLLAKFPMFHDVVEPPEPDSIVVDIIDIKDVNITPKKIRDGIFLKRAYSEFSQNIGFNFTPLRNLNEAIFWNSSTIALASRNQASLQSDYKRFLQLNGIFKLDERLGIGLGLYWLHQGEKRSAIIDSTKLDIELNSNELMLISSFALSLKNNLSIGFSPKFIYQSVPIPTGIKRTREYIGGEVRRTELDVLQKQILTQEFDFDISATIEPIPYLRLGISLMNTLGTKLHIDEDKDQYLRAVGVGFTLQKKRVNIGGEINLRQKDKRELAFGLNYVPFNHTLINFGISSENNKFAFGINYRNIFYSYNKDDVRGNYHLTGTRFKF